MGFKYWLYWPRIKLFYKEKGLPFSLKMMSINAAAGGIIFHHFLQQFGP